MLLLWLLLPRWLLLLLLLGLLCLLLLLLLLPLLLLLLLPFLLPGGVLFRARRVGCLSQAVPSTQVHRSDDHAVLWVVQLESSLYAMAPSLGYPSLPAQLHLCDLDDSFSSHILPRISRCPLHDCVAWFCHNLQF